MEDQVNETWHVKAVIHRPFHMADLASYDNCA